ncbi:MAG: NADH-quinone oxidoreductase subunit J [candidate division Zixibacteria bacterium]|nr:NADH-quinone oxidoreductase subunit J [candidate division Zixibacteria bacterium]
MELAIFLISALVAIAAAFLVVIQRNPIAAVMYLVTAFVAQAVLFIQLNAAFIAVLQIIVYAGAIMVLFLFVIMLLNLRREEYGKDIRLKFKPIVVALGIVLLVEAVVAIQAASMSAHGDGSLPEMFGSIQSVGKLLFTDYLYPFELTSVLLLVAVLGAVVMAKRKL